MAPAGDDPLATPSGGVAMSLDTMKPTRDFLASVVARKRPTVYLPAATVRRGGGCGGGERLHQSQDPGKRGLILRILMLGAAPIPPMVTDIYEKIGVDRAKGRQLVTEVVNAGLVLEHQYHPSRRGGAIKVLENTEAGYRELEPLGIAQPNRVIQGSWEHNLCGAVLGAEGKRHHYQVSYEVLVGPEKDVRLDTVWQGQDGRRVFWQCAFSSPEREAQAVKRVWAGGLLADAQLVVVCRDGSFKTKLASLLKHQNVRDQSSERVGLMVFGDVLEHYYKESPEALV
jgi:hypothetical protein